MITRQRARELRQMILKASESLSDDDALQAVELYGKWHPGIAYIVDQRISHETFLYRCVQAHTSQIGWEPDKTPALWTRVSVEEWPEWVQPTGAHDAYRIGDKVSYDGKHWICTSDYNVYAPGVYGWDEVI